MNKPTGQEVAKQLFSWLNGMSTDYKDFLEELRYEHRTLQQVYFSLIMNCLQQWAEDYKTGNYDGRNEFTCQKAAEIVDKIEFMDCGRAPFI